MSDRAVRRTRRRSEVSWLGNTWAGLWPHVQVTDHLEILMTNRPSFVDAVRARLGVPPRSSLAVIDAALDSRLAKTSAAPTPLEVAIAKAGWAAPKRKGA